MRERRQAPRVAERVAVAIQGEAATFQTETDNLSTTGAYCTLDQFLAPMTKLQLELELPRGGGSSVRVRCEGVVVRVEPVIQQTDHGRYHVAIFFTEIADHDRAAISQFILRRLRAAHTE